MGDYLSCLIYDEINRVYIDRAPSDKKKKKKNYIQENVYFPIFKLSSTTSNMDLLIL